MKQEEFEREIWKAYQAGKEMGAQRGRPWWIPAILLLVGLNVVVRL